MAKIYNLPAELPAPEVDYRNFDFEKMQSDEETHQKALKAWLIAAGYNKPLTGEILREGVADGCAQYMVADGGRQWALIHLPYGDAYHAPYANRMTKSDVKKRIEMDKKWSKMVASTKQKQGA